MESYQKMPPLKKTEPLFDIEHAFLDALSKGVLPEATRQITLSEFLKESWQILEPGKLLSYNWHLDAIAEHLEAVTRREFRNLLITIAPRSLKSILTSVCWPAWTWTQKPEERFLCSSYSQSLATEHSVACRQIIRSDWYKKHWGQMFMLSGDQNLKTFFENTKRGQRIATSVGGTGTGRGGDVLIIDDPHNVREAPSATARKSVLTWWTQVMSSRLNDPQTGCKVIIMQRCHEDDLAHHIIKSDESFEYLNLPTEFELKRKSVTVIGWEDPRIKENELMHPARFGDMEVVRAKKTLGSYGYASQYQQRPSPAEGGMIRRTWWKFYDEFPKDVRGRPQFDEILQSWDMAFKDEDTSSFVVGQVWGRLGADKYLIDQIRGKMDFVKTVDALVRLTNMYPMAIGKLVEDKANGIAVMNYLQKVVTGLIPVNPEGGKVARLYAVSPQIESGNVYLPKNAEWIDDFIEEFSSATPEGGGKYWDQIDAATQALNRMLRAKVHLTWGRNKNNGNSNVVPMAAYSSGGRKLTFGKRQGRRGFSVLGNRRIG